MTQDIQNQIIGSFWGIVPIIAIFLVVVVIIEFVFILLLKKKNKQQPDEEPQDNNLPYKICNRLLTDKELKFYQSLKPITDELGYNIMCKVRLADLAELPNGTPQYMKWFNAVRSKHIDFVICSGDTSPLFAVEVDDKSHDKEDRKKRDAFVNKIFEGSPVKLLRYRTWTNEQLKKDISDLNLLPNVNNFNNEFSGQSIDN